MIDGNTIHRTSTGKIFQMLDSAGNPTNYDQYKDIFSRFHMRQLEVGQMLKSRKNGIMLKRLK